MLTHEQIQELFRFCEKHYVRHYDVQVELVDHLANAIEEKMQEDPSMSFEKALDMVYAGFGRKGFAGIVASKMEAMRKQCNRTRRSIMLSWYTFPKIARTACFFIVMLVIGLNLSKVDRWYFTIFIAMAVSLAGLVLSIMSSIALRVKGKQLVLMQAAVSSYICILLIYYVHKLFNWWLDEHASFEQWFEWQSVTYFIVILVVSTFVFTYELANYYTSKKVRQMAMKQYPLAFAK